jgi:predicted DNA binding CopG/RHH family protein
MKKEIKLDGYEKDIEKNIDKFKQASSRKISKIEKIIDTANEKKSINLRVYTQDLEQIKLQAQKEGIPYQTFISSILHKFVTGQFVDEKSIYKSILLLKRSSAI